ncbi:ribonuclease MRP subunit rmp1 [Fusarium beomiforme]|uniref:Ribonuclease MRP subunit rmp1 n=1 Tax=Fusarium beomiforme TaxID=44412 RepID=A0A9P5DSC8_9HYPO|nr:ribonuclease MRP subunit rmp1 [Fusarium beomiforme]
MTSLPDTALLATTSDSLAPLITILNAFTHRHKNQHSSSHWWSSFSLLRRAVRNLNKDLNSRPRKTKAGAVNRDVQPALTRAKWMMSHVIPRAFVTFSQLAADNQHAPLGLLLLSVLARTNTLLSKLVPDHDNEDSVSAFSKRTPSKPNKSQAPDVAMGEASSPGMDMGVAISRHELPSTQKKVKTIHKTDSRSEEPRSKEHKMKTMHTDTKRVSSKNDTTDRPKKKKKKGDAFSSLFGDL